MPEVFDASKDKPLVEPAPIDVEIPSSDLLDKAKNFVHKKVHSWEAADRYSSVMRDESPSGNPFHAYAPKPLSVQAFDSQQEDEQILLLLRQHPITQIGKLLIAVFMLLFPLTFPYASFYSALPGTFQTAILLFWYLLTTAFIFESFLSWYYNAYIVTDERVIDIDFLSLIYKNISAAKIDNIEDVTSTTGGALQSVFNYGSVKIQTAAATTEFEFENVPKPSKVTQFLNELILEEEREKNEGRVS